MRTRRVRQLALAALVLLTAACTASGSTSSTSPSSTAALSEATSNAPTSDPAATTSFALPAGPTCGRYAAPDPHRPRMTLTFDVSADHRTVHGRETIVFRPDLPVTELVFRLSANSSETVAGHNRITVTAARADHGAQAPRYTRANAAAHTQGGLLHLPFAHELAAGTTITAHLEFTVLLGTHYFDRFGRAGHFAYFGSAQPLLAWQRGYGWHTEDLADVSNETATSEAMDVDLTVHAPASDTVIMSGDPADPPPSTRPRSWHAHLTAARDVSVAVGPFVTNDVTVGSVRVRVGASTAKGTAALAPEVARAITVLSALFGPYPFPTLSVADLPARGGGIEYPSSTFLFGSDRYIVVHEVAHQWFYALVGNSQARHPWLDEAFAQYAEEIVDDEDDHTADLDRPRPVDSSTESFGRHVLTFVQTVYGKGAQALRTARATGAEDFDQAIRCYVAKNAWRIAEPSDVATALARLPAALAVLRRAGAVR